MAEQTFLNIANVPVDNSPVNIIGIDGESHWVKVSDFAKLIEGKDINPNSVKIGNLTYKDVGVFYGSDDSYGIKFLSRASNRAYWPEVKPQVVGEAEGLLLDDDNSNFLATTEWVNRTKQSKLPTDGDGTKFLNDKGQYSKISIPRPLIIYRASSSVTDTGITIVFEGSSLSPSTSRVTPQAGDYILYDGYLHRVDNVTSGSGLTMINCYKAYSISIN